MLSPPDTRSRLSPEGRLTRGWCTLAFPTSDWNVYTGIFCRWKMGEYPNVRERFDVNNSKSQYFIDKMAAPFGPFHTSTTNPASYHHVQELLGYFQVLISAIWGCSVSFLLSTFRVQRTWQQFTWVLSSFEFHQISASLCLDNSVSHDPSFQISYQYPLHGNLFI